MQRKSVNTFLQPDLCASRSLRANSSYVNRISHDIIVTEDQQMDIVNITLASCNVSMLRLCALPQYAGAWLTAVRLTGRRLHKGTDALWWWRQWGAASSSRQQPPCAFWKLANCRKQPDFNVICCVLEAKISTIPQTTLTRPANYE